MGYTPLDKEAVIASGNAIADLLNRTNIECNCKFNVKSIGYADATDELVFVFNDDTDAAIFPRDSFGVADWDEDHNSQPFYMVQDSSDVTHLFKFYTNRNDSLEIMRQLKELL